MLFFVVCCGCLSLLLCWLCGDVAVRRCSWFVVGCALFVGVWLLWLIVVVVAAVVAGCLLFIVCSLWLFVGVCCALVLLVGVFCVMCKSVLLCVVGVC